MMPADFARLSPTEQRPRAAGDNETQHSGGAFAVGRTDAGRPGLPLPLEVHS